MLTAAQQVEKWARRMKNANADVKAGVDAVTIAPGIKAAAKAEKYKNGIIKAVESGKWQKRVSGVTLEDWKNKMNTIGIQRISGGVDAAMPRMSQVVEQLNTQVAQVKAVVDKMPDNTPEERIQKMLKNVELMSKIKITV